MGIFQNVIINGRPACGKSELIDFLKKMPDDERAERCHVGRLEELDDFPWLNEVCTQDNEREARGEKRLHTIKTEEGFELTTPKFRGSLIGKFNDVITKKYLNRPEFYKNGTLFIEFARGKGDGFKDSLEKFKREILEKSAILHIAVSFEESYKRNDARYRKVLKDSILFHKVPDKDMNEYFIENDWDEMTDKKPHGFITLGGVRVPFVTMMNEPELPPGPEIAKRYETAFEKLYGLYQSRVSSME